MPLQLYSMQYGRRVRGFHLHDGRSLTAVRTTLPSPLPLRMSETFHNERLLNNTASVLEQSCWPHRAL